jgi:uncharacterized protein (TIGR02594 family)
VGDLMADPRWLAEARTFIGTREAPGRKHESKILHWWKLIRAPFTDDLTPWCAGFVGGMLEMSGIKSSRSAAARSYLKWGVKIDRPVLGCIVVFERGPRNGHVGFFVGKDSRGNLRILGGNQGDAVNVKSFDPARVIGYRWPTGEPFPASRPVPVEDTAEPVSRRESFADLPPDTEEVDGAVPSTLVGQIKQWMNGIGTTVAALFSSLFDWRIAALVVAAGLIIFCIIWFSKRR